MPKFAADENFNGLVLRGLQRERPELDIVRIQDTAVAGKEDPIVLEWTAQQDRVLLTHDVNTIVGFAYDRVQAGLKMPGVLEISDQMPIGQAIEEILLIIEASFEGEWENQVRYIPL
jgi:hypothetical protein